ncbi:FAST kinase domain-containing protein 1, mitochondrial-like [Physella acuta]|uniref:FAST kinase domain-containing protein 1, mitochondrial-like n=1 Tax=Physella acuta TaxID=109671 RepID=UPI0027DC7A31|nr:FAST kinase domain-containing protein 1, mitochondrial-like [Physella acuta]XP_059142217.1 FAST kinase domain-containing protein 1, mitochondrial-like [Physella acuta]
MLRNAKPRSFKYSKSLSQSGPHQPHTDASASLIKCEWPLLKPVSTCCSLINKNKPSSVICNVLTKNSKQRRQLCHSLTSYSDQPVRNSLFTKPQMMSVCNQMSRLSSLCFHSDCEQSIVIKSNNIQLNNSDAHSKPDQFVEQIDCCVTPGHLLNEVEANLNSGNFSFNQLPFVIAKFKKLVYKSLDMPWMIAEEKWKKKQLEFNFLSHQLLGSYISDPRFENILALTEENINNLSLDDCLQVFYDLNFLLLSASHPLNEKLYCICAEKIGDFDFHQLALFTECIPTSPPDYLTMGKVTNRTKILLTTQHVENIDLSDLCEILYNLKHVISSDMFRLSAEVLLAKFEMDAEHMTLDDISKICFFASIPGNDSLEILSNWIMSLPKNSCQHVIIDKSTFTFDVATAIGSATWICPILKEIQAFCSEGLQHVDKLSNHEVAKMVIINTKFSPEEQQMMLPAICQCIEESDTVLLKELLLAHVKQVNLNPTVMASYQERLSRLVAQLDSEQLNKLLLLHDDGDLAFLIYVYIRRISYLKIPLHKSLSALCDKLCSVRGDEWDVPRVKVQLAVIRYADLVRAGSKSGSNIHFILKFLGRLGADDLMSLYGSLASLFFIPGQHYTVKQGTMLMQAKAKAIFNERLTSSPHLPKSLTSLKILSLIPPGKLYLLKDLVLHLDKFTTDMDETKVLKVLRILELSTEKIHFYHKEMFENLINFLMNCPKCFVLPSLQLLKTLSYSGYTPENIDPFKLWIHKLLTQVFQQDLGFKYIQLELIYCLSIMGIYFDDLLSNVFTLNFISELEKDLLVLTTVKANKIRSHLIELSSSIAIECPQLSFPVFSKLLTPKEVEEAPVVREGKIIASLHRVCEGKEFVKSPTTSPYGHNIDALLCFDSNKTLVKPADVLQEPHGLLNVERIAVIYLAPSDFCLDNEHITGFRLSSIRQLEILGYYVIMISHKDLLSMELHSEKNLDNYIREKINSVVKFQLLPPLQ